MQLPQTQCEGDLLKTEKTVVHWQNAHSSRRRHSIFPCILLYMRVCRLPRGQSPFTTQVRAYMDGIGTTFDHILCAASAIDFSEFTRYNHVSPLIDITNACSGALRNVYILRIDEPASKRPTSSTSRAPHIPRRRVLAQKAPMTYIAWNATHRTEDLCATRSHLCCSSSNLDDDEGPPESSSRYIGPFKSTLR